MRKSLWWRCGAVTTILVFFAITIHAEETFIMAGAVVDPIDGRIERDVLIRVQGGKIEEIRRDAFAPKDANLIDLGDMYVLPGLFDCHTHLCSMVPINGACR